MPHRFHVPGLKAEDGMVSLPADEARHLTRVLRLEPGARVRVFDGRGREFEAEVTVAARDRAEVRLTAEAQPAAEPRVALTLWQAVLKADATDAVVRDATMAGVGAIQPVVSTRSELAPGALARGRRHERWQRIAVSSAKQCGRAVVPEVRAPVTFGAVASAAPAGAGPRLILVEPASAMAPASLADLAGASAPASASILVGPEGGWTRAELDAAVGAGWRPLTLGPRTLRADATALVAISLLLYVWE